jgi:outer membrane protein assembly factor BamB
MFRLAPAALVVGVLFVGCRGADRPHPGTAGSFATEIGKAGQSLRGVAGDGASVFAARGDASSSELEARKAGTDAIMWHVTLPGSAGPLASGSGLLIATLLASGTIVGPAIGAPVLLHGEPSALVVAVDPATGAPRWRVPFDAAEFVVITSIAPIEGVPAAGAGFVVGGTFSGTLRVGDTALSANARTVVSSAGRNDGFVAELTTTGAVRWLVRVGGSGADSVQGVAARGDRVAIAGVFTAGAELLGEPLAAFDEKLPFADGFVAELDASGTRRWQQTFGGKLDDAVAGVAIDSKNRVIVAATVRDSIRLGGRDLGTRGPADGLVAWFSPAGEPGSTTIIGGSEFDGLRAIATVDDRVVVAGFFSGTLALGKRSLTASGGADSFLVDVNAAGELETSWHAAGPGREEITSLSAVPGGFVAGIAHTSALKFEEANVPAPQDPSSGATLVGRPAP